MLALYILSFVLIVFLSIAFHEFGHLSISRLYGVKVDHYAIGWGKILFRHKSKKTGTEYQLRLLPIGGECGIKDEDLFKLPGWKHCHILLQGVINNMILTNTHGQARGVV